MAANRLKQWTRRLLFRQPHGGLGGSSSNSVADGPSESSQELFDPTWPELVENPYPIFHRLRAAESVYWCSPMNSWLVTRYADVVTVLRDELLSSDRELWPQRPLRGIEDCLGAFGRVKTMINSDQPQQERLRQPTVRLFSFAVVEAERPRVQALVDELLDAVEPAGQLDVASDLAIPLAVTGVTDVLGVPPQDREAAFRWSEAFGATLDFLDPLRVHAPHAVPTN